MVNKHLALVFFFVMFSCKSLLSQHNIVTYAGNAGKETFYDVTQITDGTFLICGYADNLDWIPANVPFTELQYDGIIPNSQGSNRFGFILHISGDLQTIKNVVHFPKGGVEDIRFIRTNSLPYEAVGDLYISCTTSDTRANGGGYLLAKLNGNFIIGIPDALVWHHAVWAGSGPKDYHPWDLTSDGKVFYISGESFGYDWSAIYCLDSNGQRTVVENWRTHWMKTGSEWHGTPASDNPSGSIESVDYSAIVLKIWGRCDLRSWTQEDYLTISADGNGGTKQGKWPTDILFNGPCDPGLPSSNGPGYTGYSPASTSPVHGGTSIAIDRRNNDLYIGMNMKSVLPGGNPDFEPAVIAMDATGALKWWSRLYHEVTPSGDTMVSEPDQYIDALAIDYQSDMIVVGARCHGNNVENFWRGNRIYHNPAATGFQNNFTGTSGNIHISWIGKLQLEDGNLFHATYMAEYAEGTNGLGSPHPDPNLDGWPNPVNGWPNLNTTRMARNNMKVSSNGDVCVLGVGRRTITTANAYQKMVKPANGGKSAWNSFVRVYSRDLRVPKYSSLIVGVWDTLTEMGGGNTELFGVYKTSKGVVCVGRQTANIAGSPVGNNLPVIHSPLWGRDIPENESAILVYYQSDSLHTDLDTIISVNTVDKKFTDHHLKIFPNPANDFVKVYFEDAAGNTSFLEYQILDLFGRTVQTGYLNGDVIQLKPLVPGMYVLQFFSSGYHFSKKLRVN